MKLVPSALLAAFVCIAVMADAAATPVPVVSVHTSTPTVGIGDSVVVNVEISGVTDLFGFQLDLAFDPMLLSFTGGASTEGAFLPSGGATFFTGGTYDGVGAVTNTFDTLISAVPGVTGSGVLATFDFTAIAAGVSALTVGSVILVDSNLDLLDFTTSGASVKVEQSATVPEPNVLLLLAIGLAGIAFVRRRAA